MSVRPLLLGFTVPDEAAADLFRIDPAPAVQTHKFAWSLARSLQQAFGDVRLLSACPVQSYPLVRRIIFRRFRFEQEGVGGAAIGFVNLIVFKHVTRFVACLLATRTVIRTWRINTVFIHGVHTPYLLYGYLLQRLGLAVVPVLTDPPGVILPTDSVLSRTLKQLDRRIVRFFLVRSTALVALAPGLVEPYPEVARTLVFPGILSRDWLDQLAIAPGPEPDRPLTVLYAGGISAAYGVDRLLDAAEMLPDVRFVLFGKGDQVERITAERHPNVTYGGFVSSAELARGALAADILINPRPSGEDFARNSFPSKLIEYAATGRSVLTTRIQSIPEAIASCFSYIDDESPGGIAQAIRALAAVPVADRLARASASKARIMQEYSEASMALRLRDLVSAGAAR